MSDNCSDDLNSWHTNFATTTDDIQEFMKITYYMMGIVDEFIGMCDASTYGGFRDNDFRMFKRMHKEMDDIIERRGIYINKQSGVIMEIVSIDRVKARKPHKCDMCGKKIEVGEEYEAQNLVCYNEMYTFHQCDRCKPYVDELWSIGFDNDLDGLDSCTFYSFMSEEHNDVLDKWYEEDGYDE